MSEYAYKDLERNKRIDPFEAFGERGKVDHYYCPNKECMAYLRVVSPDRRRKNPFFRAIPSHKHIEGCNYKALYNEEAQKEKIQKNNKGLHHYDFSIDTLYERLTAVPEEEESPDVPGRKVDVETEETRERLISSTMKLTRTCNSMDITDKLGETEIRDFLIDSRTVFDRYKYFIKDADSGNKVFLLILPLAGMGYKEELERVYLSLNVSFLNGNSTEYKFEVRFPDKKRYRDFRKAALDLRETRSTVGILTKLGQPYDNNDHYFICEIKTAEQLYIAKDYQLVKTEKTEKL